MNHTKFKKELLALSRRIAQSYSPGTLQTNVKMELVRNGISTGEIHVKSMTGKLGDGRQAWLTFDSDNFRSDCHEAKHQCMRLWRNTITAFES